MSGEVKLPCGCYGVRTDNTKSQFVAIYRVTAEGYLCPKRHKQDDLVSSLAIREGSRG